MSKKLVNIILGVVALVLVILIVKSIKGPIDRKIEIEKVENLVKIKLGDIKEAQMVYKDMNDTFASSFADLIEGIKNGKIKRLRKLGGKGADTAETVEVDTMYVGALEETFGLNYPIDMLGKVPPSNKKEFLIETAILDKNGIKVPVFQITDPDPINPERALRIGSLQDAVYTGNWK